MVATRFSFAILVCLYLFIFSAILSRNAIAQVATVADAKRVLNLSEFRAVELVGDMQKSMAWQSYRAKGEVEDVARKVDSALTKNGLTQLAGAMFSPAYCTVTYGKDGFHFVLTVMPSESGIAQVNLANIGNVDFRKLPVASLGKELFVQPASAIFVSDRNVEETRKSCREVLEKDGWEWFGETTVSFYMRKKAVRLQTMCSESPAQKGQTMIQVSAEQMSSTLPIIPELVRIDYTEQTGRLDGDSKLSTGELTAQLRKALEKDGWKATTDEPLKIDFRETTFFRNASEELVELSIHQFDDLSRFEMKYMTAEQVAEENRLAKAAAEKAQEKMPGKQDRLNNPVAISIEPFESATLKESKPQLLEFTAASGKARSIVTAWIAKQKAAGWTVETTIDMNETGDYTLTNGEQKLMVNFMDPGFIPAEITVKTVVDFKIEVKK